MKIRLLQENDIEAAADIVRQNYSKKYQRSSIQEMKEMFGTASAKPIYYVAEDKGTIVGFAGYIQSWMDYHIYQVFWVNVTPIQQGKGIGKQLVTKIIMEIRKKKKANMIQLTTSSPIYYKKHFGFKTVQIFNDKSHHLMTLCLEK